MRQFLFQIVPGTVDTYKWDATFHQHLFSCLSSEFRVKSKVFPLSFRTHGHHFSCCHLFLPFRIFIQAVFPIESSRYIHRPHPIFFEGFLKLAIKINGIIRIPITVPPTSTIRSTTHPSLYRMVINLFYTLFGRSPTDTTGQIDLNPGLCMFRESKTDDTGSRRNGQFRTNPIIVQGHGIITGFSHFGVMRITGTVAFFGMFFTPFGRM